MKITYRRLLENSAVLLAVCLFSGCAYTTKGTKLGPITPPPPASFKPVIEHTVGDFAFTLEGGKMITSNYAGKLVNQQILDAWKKRKHVREVKYVEAGGFTGKADYNLTLSGSQYGESNIATQILTGLTLFLFPNKVTQHYDIQYTLYDVKTGEKFTASVEEANNIYQELFLLFALPFSHLGQKAMFERMGDHLYSQFYQQGAFQTAIGEDTSNKENQ